MELASNIDYSELINYIKKLPQDKINFLINELQEMEKNNNSLAKKNNFNEFQKLLLTGPTWTDEEYNSYLEAKKYFKKLRLK